MPRLADELVAMRDNSNAPLFNLPAHKIEITDAVEMAYSQLRSNSEAELSTVKVGENHQLRTSGSLDTEAVNAHFKTANVIPPFDSQFLEFDQHAAMVRGGIIPVHLRANMANFRLGVFLECTEVADERGLVEFIKRATKKVSQFHGRAKFERRLDLLKPDPVLNGIDADTVAQIDAFSGIPISFKYALVFNFAAIMDGQVQVPFSYPIITFANEDGFLVHATDICYTVSPIDLRVKQIANDFGERKDGVPADASLPDFYGGSLDTPITSAHIRIARAASMLTMFSLGLLNCKNVTVEDVEHPPKLQAKRARKGREPLVEYKVLSVQVGGSYRRLRDLTSRPKGEGKNALHSVRGHFANYTEEKPLFGHYVGQVFRMSHMRGQEKFGEIKKDYRLRKGV